MNYIKRNLLENNLYYDNTLILKYHIEYPSIYSSPYQNGINEFNNYYMARAYDLKKRTENELYKEAIETYKYNKENGYPVMVYEVYSNFEVTYNRFNIVSLYMDEYTFTGGAHGSTIRTSRYLGFITRKNASFRSFFPK